MYSMEALSQFLDYDKILICCLKESLKTACEVRRSGGRVSVASLTC